MRNVTIRLEVQCVHTTVPVRRRIPEHLSRALHCEVVAVQQRGWPVEQVDPRGRHIEHEIVGLKVSPRTNLSAGQLRP